MIRALAFALAATALAACNPSLVAESLGPPGRAATLDADSGFWGVKSYRLQLSQGVAMALSCSSGGPCDQLTATSDNAAIAEVRPAALQTLQTVGLTGVRKPAAAFVVIGKSPGTTTIRLRSHDGDRDLRVTVIPPPLPTVAAVTPR